jgi:hypothetical protein
MAEAAAERVMGTVKEEVKEVVREVAGGIVGGGEENPPGQATPSPHRT